jgi:hypothetical protein
MPNFNPIGQIGGLLRSLPGALSSKLPTALNPLATRNPTTFLGQAGKMFNPLNPINAGTAVIGLAADRFLPESLRDNVEAFMYGAPAGIAYSVFDQPAGATGKTEEQLMRDSMTQNPNRQSMPQRPLDTLATLGGKQVAWKGPDLGWQRTYSEGVSPPSLTPAPPRDLNNGWQAGQAGSNMISNGAGVLAQRPDVTNRALSQEVLNAAQQFSAPANVPLPAFYEGQQQLGRSMMQNGTLVSQLQELGGARGMTPENLKTWATANPALAYREIQKLKGRL